MPFGTVEQAIADIRAGKLVIVADDENRENEGDLVGAADRVTPDMINFMATYGRGLICLTLTPERCQALGLPQQVEHNTEDKETAFTVSIDAARRFGVTTGIWRTIARRRFASPSTRRRCRPICAGPGTCSRCAPVPAACCSAWARPKRAWTWRGSRGFIPPA